MERLWSPWRSEYIESMSGESDSSGDYCLFCDALNTPERDAERYVLFRAKFCYVIMNLYPYNNGHLMVVPHRHLSSIVELNDNENSEIMRLLSRCSRVLTKALQPHGFNIGANIGRVSGAGIDRHVHFHVVPRWNGDTNFMPVLGDTKVISEEMAKTFVKLKNHFTDGSS